MAKLAAMKPKALAFALFSLTLAAVSPARGADVAGARTFLTEIYSHYPQPSNGPGYDPTGANAAAVFDPSIIALLRENARLTPKGEVGAIDGDPICDCQDDGGMRSAVGAVRLVGPGTASAEVKLLFSQASPPQARRVTFTLVTVGGQWRVRDIRSKEMPSFRAYLQKANQEAGKRR